MNPISSARTHALTVVSNALATVIPQTLALLLLKPVAFGQYSLIYLVYAFGASVALSSVSEAAARTAKASGRTAVDEPSHSAALTHISILMGVAGAVSGGLISHDIWFAVTSFLCVAMGTFRTGARYLEVATGRHLKAVRGDLAVAFLPCVVWGFGTLATLPSDALMGLTAWGLGLGFSLIVTTSPRLGNWTTLREWYMRHRGAILTLQGESWLMDFGALATPALLLPVLGVPHFGTYRAASNVAAPVRLLLNPLRPVIGTIPVNVLIQSRMTRLVMLAALLLGVAVLVAFALLQRWNVQMGTLTSLLPFAMPVAVYVTSNFLGHFAYIVARFNSSAKVLIRMRWLQTAMVTVLPLVGGLIWGLGGALWGLAISSTLSSVFWTLVVTRSDWKTE